MANKRGQRYTLHQTEACRAKIKTTALVNRLHANAMGEIELTPTQVRSIEILLNKTLANLTAAEIRADVASYVARLPSPAPSAEAWAAKFNQPILCSQRPTEARTVTEGLDKSLSKAKH